MTIKVPPVSGSMPAATGRTAVSGTEPEQNRRRGRNSRTKGSRRGTGWWSLLFVAPGVALFALFVLWPLTQALVTSLYSWDGFTPKKWVGLGNYSQLINAPLFWSAVEHTMIYAVGTVVAKIVLALALALMVDRGLRAVAAYRSILFLPVLMSFVAVGLLWGFLYDPELGLINNALSHVGVGGIAWLGDPSTALMSIMIVDTWKWLGYHVVLLVAGLQLVRPDLYEAAKSDGASAWAAFWHVTLPAMKTMIGLNIVIAFAGALNAFDLVYVMTKGGPFHSTDTIMTYMYDQAFNQNRLGYASAVACALFVLVAVATLIQVRLLRSDYET